MLQKVRNQSMSDLCIENEIANQVKLANECRCIFAEIMEDLHHLVGLKNLLESMQTWVYCSQINQETFVRKINLNELHASTFCKTFTVKSKNWSWGLLGSIQNSFRELLELPRFRNDVVGRLLESLSIYLII